MQTPHPVRPLPSRPSLAHRRFACPEVFESIRCEDLGSKRGPIESVAPDEPLGNAVGRMWWCQIGALPVIDRDRLVGCIGEDDLLRMCASRAREHEAAIEEQGEDLPVWETLLADLSARDAMTDVSELAVMAPDTSLLDGIRRLAQPTRAGSMQRHLFVAGDEQQLLQIVSIRDVGRRLAWLYEDEAADLGTARTVQRVLDVPVGEFRAVRSLGHEPILASGTHSGPETLAQMWASRRGYLLVSFADGGPRGICTRHDLLRGLKNPYARLGDLAIGRLMTARVESASRLTTLGGVFRLMAIGGYRHMPLLDDEQQVECMISMAEAVGVLAGPGAGG